MPRVSTSKRHAIYEVDTLVIFITAEYFVSFDTLDGSVAVTSNKDAQRQIKELLEKKRKGKSEDYLANQ